jgi:hypothetical protein
MDRFTWGVVAGAVLLVLVAVGSVGVLQTRAATVDLTRPEGVIRAYYAAFEADRPERAWDLLSSTATSRTTRDSFIQRATGYRPSHNARITVDRVEVEGETAYAYLSIAYGGGGLLDSGTSARTETVRLDREGGQWRITVPPDPYLLEAPTRFSAPSVPPTSVPPTSVPPTSVPPTSAPPTRAAS